MLIDLGSKCGSFLDYSLFFFALCAWTTVQFLGWGLEERAACVQGGDMQVGYFAFAFPCMMQSSFLKFFFHNEEFAKKLALFTFFSYFAIQFEGQCA